MTDERDVEVELPRGRAAPRLARLALRRGYGDRLEDDVLSDAELLVSEVASNALFHGRGRITLRAWLDEDRLLVEIIDEGSGFERELRRHGLDSVGGWGLDIVDQRSSRWGVHEGTSHVWFELELSGPRLGEPADKPDA